MAVAVTLDPQAGALVRIGGCSHCERDDSGRADDGPLRAPTRVAWSGCWSSCEIPKGMVNTTTEIGDKQTRPLYGRLVSDLDSLRVIVFPDFR